MTREVMRYKLNELRMMLNDGEHGEEQGILVDIIKELDKAENKGDLISRQVVLDELEKWDWQELYLPIHFKQILDNVPSVENKGEWIPISERLPEDDTEVIYCDKNGVRGNCHYWKGFNRYPRDKGEYQFSNDIVAWMILPEPYKENET